ncbi:Protein BFR2, partial [Smittium culicis]
GRHVIKQTKTWESALDLRIRFQKLLVKVNEFPTPSEIVEANIKSVDIKGPLDSAKSSIDNLLNKVLTVMDKIADKENIPENITDIATLKNKRAIDNVDALWQSIEARNKRIKSFRDSTLSKWDTRINLLPSNLSSKSLNAFKQNSLQQISSMMENKDRLVKRTNLARIDYNFLIPKLEISEKSFSGIFDDTDFYQALLHDLIDAKSQSSKTGSSLDTGLHKSIKNKGKKVDTKASKGRKIRYQVHEKLENFMAPSSSSTAPWTNDQIFELYNSLLGTTNNIAPATTPLSNSENLLLQPTDANSVADPEIGNFKLFNF